jgi:N-acetylglucosaminyldiphosphoundecaprenol N-acetyl-beta-D-mannosaminyltransferase
MSRFLLFGMVFDALSLPEAVDAIVDAATRGERGYVVTPNVDHVVRFQRDPDFRAAYAGAALCLADGVPVVWAAGFLGIPLKGRVAGADLLPAVCGAAAGRGLSIFLLGGEEGVAGAAASALAARFPGLRVAGTHTPPRGFGADAAATDAAITAVNAARPDILFIGLGSPKQECWIHAHWDRLSAVIAVCCGAALDYAAGTRRRAPRWMRLSGLEWVWRLAAEPGRLWRRYLVRDTAFVGIVLKEWWRRRARVSR